MSEEVRTEEKESLNFIEKIIEDDLANGRVPNNTIVTRFPPEPNGYLHVGHIKSICLNFGLAQKYNGICHLRLDDTNPAKEDMEYIDSIKSDIRWLGFDWGDHEYYASDYYDKLHEIAIDLIKKGMSSLALRRYLPSGYLPSPISLKSWRFSSMLLSRSGLFLPGVVSVPRFSLTCSGVWLST